MTPYACDALDIKHTLRRDTLPRIEGRVFDAEFTCERNYAPRLLCRFLNDCDHVGEGKLNLHYVSSANVGEIYACRFYG